MENLTNGRERRQRAGSDLLSYKSDTDNSLDFLAPCPSVKSQLDLIVTGLRRRQLCGGYNCAKTTVELIRSVIGQCKFTSTYNMMNAVRVIGRILMTSAPSEMTIGNIVRRVLFMIREEYSSQIRILEASQINLASPTSQSISPVVENAFQITKIRRTRTDSELSTSSNHSNDSIDINEKNIPILNLTIPNIEISDSLKSLKVTSPTKRSDSYSSFSAADLIDPTLQQSLGRVLSQGSLDLKSTKFSNQPNSNEYSKSFPLMRQNVIAAINELNDEMDNVYGPICEQATEHIHADEVILTYGYSLTVELFLKSAARKRKFQVIIAEDGTSLDGHKLAVSLSKIANISITLIPDSGIYAIMCRVNKVILSPHAVMADGGAIFSSGNLMVAAAAKEFTIPVVGITGAFTLTPLFAHNRILALGELLSPTSIISYNQTGINFDNVEIINLAYDYVSPDLMTLYVTNNGSHQPSYMYRLLAEYYHHQDHNI